MNKLLIGLISISLISSVSAVSNKKNAVTPSTDIDRIIAIENAEASREAQLLGAEVKRLEAEIREKERHVQRLVQELGDLKVRHAEKSAQYGNAKKYAEPVEEQTVQPSPRVSTATAHRNAMPRVYRPRR